MVDAVESDRGNQAAAEACFDGSLKHLAGGLRPLGLIVAVGQVDDEECRPGGLQRDGTNRGVLIAERPRADAIVGDARPKCLSEHLSRCRPALLAGRDGYRGGAVRLPLHDTGSYRLAVVVLADCDDLHIKRDLVPATGAPQLPDCHARVVDGAALIAIGEYGESLISQSIGRRPFVVEERILKPQIRSGAGLPDSDGDVHHTLLRCEKFRVFLLPLDACVVRRGRRH